MAHQFDGLVMIPNCDKNVPGLLMAAARVNIPTIFVSGGPMMAGTMNDGRRTCLSHMFEAVGAFTTPASWTRPAWRSMKTTPAPPAAPAPACTPPTP